VASNEAQRRVTRDIVVGQHVNEEKANRARQLRHDPTPEERLLWQTLRGKQLGGYRFRRQQVIGGFIVDFYCAAAGLVIEVDGSVHEHTAAYDRERSLALARFRLRVVRVSNNDVVRDLPSVLTRIMRALLADRGSGGLS